jgi:hypothetical protein
MFREILSTLHRKLNKNQKAMDLLHEFENHLPVPILFEELYEGKHYPSFIDITRTEALRKRYIEKMKEQLKKKKENHEICEKCTWNFESKADEQKHKVLPQKVIIHYHFIGI